MKKYIPPGILVFSALLFSCDSEKKISREAFEGVQQAHEVKKLKEVDIFNKAMEWGEEISKEAQEQLMKTLQTAITEHGVPGAVEFCNTKALPILKEVGDQYGVIIRRPSNNYRNPVDRPNKNEEPVLEAYEYNEKKGIRSEPNIQKVTEGNLLLFTNAITIPGALCLNCHGEPGKDINEETLNKINQLYPEDKAQGHKIGDLRGMWSIAIPQKEVVNRM
jgi:hypothetical protein